MSFLPFVKNAMKHFKEIGAVAPSSRQLALSVIKDIDFTKPQHYVELGAGTGSMTREILAKMHPESKLCCIEVNPEFCKILESIDTDKNYEVILGKAEELPKLFGENTIDAVISGLPLKNFSEQFVITIFDGAKYILKPGGVFSQYQYTLKLKSLIEGQFNQVLKRFCLINLPPAYVFSCTH